MKVRIWRPVQRDLADIRASTLRKWGRAQRVRHRANLSRGLRYLVCGSPLIVWRSEPNGPPVVARILRAFAEDLARP